MLILLDGSPRLTIKIASYNKNGTIGYEVTAEVIANPDLQDYPADNKREPLQGQVNDLFGRWQKSSHGGGEGYYITFYNSANISAKGTVNR